MNLLQRHQPDREVEASQQVNRWCTHPTLDRIGHQKHASSPGAQNPEAVHLKDSWRGNPSVHVNVFPYIQGSGMFRAIASIPILLLLNHHNENTGLAKILPGPSKEGSPIDHPIFTPLVGFHLTPMRWSWYSQILRSL